MKETRPVRDAAMGERLTHERRRLGLSQTAFARLSGASKGAQILWEQGRCFPTAEDLAAFARAGADPLFIVTGQHSHPTERLMIPGPQLGAAIVVSIAQSAMKAFSLPLTAGEISSITGALRYAANLFERSEGAE